MRPLVMVALGALGVGGLLLVSSVPKSAPKREFRPDMFVKGWPGGLDDRDRMVKEFWENPEQSKQLWLQAHEVFLERQYQLPPDAHGTQDKYTKEKYMLPSGMTFPWPSFGSIDEFGRAPEGLPSNFGATVLKIGQQVAPLIPGFGPAASAALAYAIAIGQGKSQQDAFIAAARAAVPIQYQLAFDMGVGVASGESVPEAAKQALLSKYPGSEKYYEQGKSMLEPVKVFPLP